MRPLVDKPRRVQHFRVTSRLASASSLQTRFDAALIRRVEARELHVFSNDEALFLRKIDRAGCRVSASCADKIGRGRAKAKLAPAAATRRISQICAFL
jgi:hypothetical protein